MTKTNAMRIIEKECADYKVHTYDGGALSGTEVAAALGEDVNSVYKTLVTTAGPGRFYVFVVPVAAELDLKKAAAAAGEKSVLPAGIVWLRDSTSFSNCFRCSGSMKVLKRRL